LLPDIFQQFVAAQGVNADSGTGSFFVAKKAFEDGFYDTSLKLLKVF